MAQGQGQGWSLDPVRWSLELPSALSLLVKSSETIPHISVLCGTRSLQMTNAGVTPEEPTLSPGRQVGCCVHVCVKTSVWSVGTCCMLICYRLEQIL